MNKGLFLSRDGIARRKEAETLWQKAASLLGFPARAGVILSAGLLLIQCAPNGFPHPASTATPAAPAKDSPLQVTLLQPAPIRLDPAQRTQLETARKVVERNAKMVKNTPTNPQSGPGSMEQLMWDETELVPFRKLKQGVRLKMRFTNTGNRPLSFFYGPDTSCILLTVRGRGALNLPYCGGMTLELRIGQPVTLAPGKSREFVISELKCGNRDLDRWLVTRPGDYQISAIFSTRAMAVNTGEAPAQDLDAWDFDFSLKGYEVLTTASNPVTLKVTE
jgi:hypothetical protein